MIHTLIQPLFVLVLYALVRCADISISSARARDTIRSLCYGIVAILALIYVVLTVFGL